MISSLAVGEAVMREGVRYCSCASSNFHPSTLTFPSEVPAVGLPSSMDVHGPALPTCSIERSALLIGSANRPSFLSSRAVLARPAVEVHKDELRMLR